MMFYVGEWAWQPIICLLYVLINDFAEVDEAMFQGVERPYKLIFCILSFEKSDLDKPA
jgi:hypothetical protein